MSENYELEYGIKYHVIKLDKSKFLLFPISLIKGIAIGTQFQSADDIISLICDKKDLKNKYIVDNVFSLEDLKIIYDFEEDNLNDDNQQFLGDYFYNDFKEKIIYAEITKDSDIVQRHEIDLTFIKEKEEDITYMYNKNIPSIVLNKDILNELLKCNDFHKTKMILEKYKRLLSDFDKTSKKTGVTKIHVVNGKVEEIETIKKVENQFSSINVADTKNSNDIMHIANSKAQVSYQGLCKYIKERVFGHDKEIDVFAQKLYMNYTALNNEGTEAILLVGPTGVGKTETVNAACSYLDIPSIIVNASNLVPQGIKGMSMEDVILSLYNLARFDLNKAQRGLIFLDEFDKLNDSDLDIKTVIKNILLTFTSGGIFPISTENYEFNFNSSMTNKIFAGVFDRITDNQKVAGFNTGEQNQKLLNDNDIRKKIIEKKYFTLEEISRISTILVFNDLDRETKKKILLESKLSELYKKNTRYKRQFGIDIKIDDTFIDAILDSIPNSEMGMRSVNNAFKRILNDVERSLLENENVGYKKLILTKDTVINSNNFDLL